MPKKAALRGQLIERTKGTFLLRVYIGRDEAGKRRYVNKTVKGTRQDANKELAKLLVGHDTGTIATKPSGLLVDYVRSWITSRIDISADTRAQYEHRLTKDIEPYFSAFKLVGLTPENIEGWITWMDDTRKLSPRTIRYSYTVLHAALERAVERGHLGKNPCATVKLPAKTHREMLYLTSAEVQTLLASTADSKDHPLWVLLLHGGLRPQEALGLRWSDLKGNYLTIQRAQKKGGETGATKRKASNRTITLGSYAVEELKKLPQPLDRESFIFESRDLSNIRKRWKTALKKAGVSEVRLYDTRHTHATGLLTQGVNLKVVSERLGHSSVQVTADVYTHVLPELDASAADLVGESFTPLQGAKAKTLRLA